MPSLSLIQHEPFLAIVTTEVYAFRLHANYLFEVFTVGTCCILLTEVHLSHVYLHVSVKIDFFSFGILCS